MCWQGDKLAEPCLLEEGGQLIVLGCADVKVSHNQGVLVGVDALAQMVDHLGEGLILGPVYGYDGQLRRVNHHQLEVWLCKDAATASHPVLYIGDHSSTAARAREMSAIALQLVLFLLLLRGFQPGFKHKKDVALHQGRICLDVLHMLAQRAGVEGADPQPRCFGILPITGILVHRDLVHPFGFAHDLVIDSDLLCIQLVNDVKLFQTLHPREHDVRHASLMHRGDIHNQGVGFRHCLTLKFVNIIKSRLERRMEYES